ncbi:MAG: hypothetical protein QM778_22260 [Myxococcales bacterium]
MPRPSPSDARYPRILLRVDGCISLCFGAVALLFQHQVFSTAVDLAGAGAHGDGTSLLESALSTLSGYYLLVGGLLLALAGLMGDHARRLWLLVGLHHAGMAFKGLLEAHRPWMVGNPWWDVAIHTGFFVAYTSCLVIWRSEQPAR